MTQDAIIIGSGLGGLTCAAALSSVGVKVQVLEKHHSIGGYLQGFRRGHWHWNVGTHYIGDRGAAGIFTRLMDALTDGQVVLHRLDDSYERIISDDYRHNIVANTNGDYLRRLQEEFPAERANLSAFFKLLEKLNRRQGLLYAPKLFGEIGKYLVYAFNRLLFFAYWNETLEDVLDRYFDDARLKMILAVHCDKTLMRPNEASFLSWAVIQNSYLHGASYPAGSGETISEGLRNKIVSNGGSVRTRAGVRQLLLNGNRVTGVQLDTGEIIEGQKVISNIGIIETAEQLMPNCHPSPKQRTVADRYRPSGAYMTLHIGFEGDLSSFDIRNANYRVLDGDPFDFDSDPVSENWHPSNILITFPSIRDQAHRDALHHTAEMIIPTRFRHFERWSDTIVNRRGDDYLRLKKRIAKKLIAILDTTFPGISSYVAYTDLSTPVSFRDYTGHKHGAAYGLSSPVGRATDLNLNPVSDIKGLYYTGADSLSQGITGTFISGVFTAVAASKDFRIFALKPNSQRR